jgi:hypothetical protein
MILSTLPPVDEWTPLINAGTRLIYRYHLADGQVLVVGGYGPLGKILGSAEIYNPATGDGTRPR